MTDHTPPSDEETLTQVGWWCWRGDNHGHLATEPCRSDNVPIHVPAEWAVEMRAVIQQIADGDEEESPAASPAAVPPADRPAVLRAEAALIRAHCPDHLDSNSADGAWISCHCDVADDMLRRLAAEATAPETQPGTCGHRSPEGHLCTQPTGHLGYHRHTQTDIGLWVSWLGELPTVDEEAMCSAEPPASWPGDCWCTLPEGHEGPHRCQPCSSRHDAPGWSDEPAAVSAGVQPDTEATP